MNKMYLKIKRTILVAVLCSICLPFFAQNDREFRAEIGLLGGVAYYLGDANHTLFRNITPAYGALFRYRFDTRFAARAEFLRTSVKGGMDGFTFDNRVHTLDIAGEFNFFDLENNPHRRFSRIFSPYIFVGIGAMNYLYEESQQFNLSLPFGVGVKVKLGNRLNLNAQFSNRLLFADNLEGISVFNNPHGLNGRNILNNDMLSTLTVGITFDIWRRNCECMGFVNTDNSSRRRR
jgi:hypothetical protein